MSGFWHLTPVEQKPFDRITRKLFCRSASVLGRPPLEQNPLVGRSFAIEGRELGQALKNEWVLFNGGGRGRTRSDGRAFVLSGQMASVRRLGGRDARPTTYGSGVNPVSGFP